jgi:methanogenic corrinoid protein MtbC1/DNA-binding XRE family transcriptional regulator
MKSVGSSPPAPVKRYLDALLKGDEEAAAAAVASMMEQGAGLLDVYIKLLTPAMTRMGELWRERKINVAQQKLATQITLSQMDRLRSPAVAKPKSAFRALVCCVTGELHSTGARMIADLFRLEGWSVDFLGADVPSGDVAAMVQSRRPHILALSVTMKANLKHLRALLGALGRQVVPAPTVIIGGQAAEVLTGWKIKDLDFRVAPSLMDGLNIALSAFRAAPPRAELPSYLGEIGRRIRERRISKGQTQAQLAQAAGLNRAYIVSVERGKQNITVAVLVKIANALGVPTEELMVA